MQVESSVMDDCLIDSVIYRQWVCVDRSTIETISQSADYFVTLCARSWKSYFPTPSLQGNNRISKRN